MMIRTLQLSICLLFSLTLGTSLAQPSNDNCESARILGNLNFSCAQLSFFNATFDHQAGFCGPQAQPNVWFQFTAQGRDVDIDVTGGSDAFVTLYRVDQAEPCNDTMWVPEGCDTNNISFTNRLVVGRSYRISVAFADSTEVGYEFCINNPAPQGLPPNDIPCTGEFLEPDGSCHFGHNLNATSDWANPMCTNSSGASVWFRTALTPGHTRLQVILDPNFRGNYSMFLVRFNNNNCGSFPIIMGDTVLCGSSPIPDTIIFENLSTTDLYYLQIASRTGVEGTFEFCMQELDDPSGCALNDDCLSATPISVPLEEADTLCFTGCNSGASAGAQVPNSGCFFMDNPTTWHRVIPEPSAVVVRIVINSTDLSSPHVAVYSGDTCTNLTPLVCDFSTTGFIDIVLFEPTFGHDYFVAVSDLNGAEGIYDVCVDQFTLDVGCRLVSSFRAVNTSFGSPINGPYQSGESVTFCYEVSAWQKGLCNWLQGIVPQYGDAWDPTSFKISGEPATVTDEIDAHVPGRWLWYSEGSVQYNVANPSKGYNAGSPLSGGWYFTNNDFSVTDPNNSRGDSDNCDLESGVSWEVCFALKVKDFADCQLLGTADASVRMETFADSEIGNYPAISCLNDQAQILISDLVCCEGPNIADALYNVCNGSQVSHNINPSNDPDINPSWEVNVPDGVFGPTSGTGNLISQSIFNFTEDRQTVYYVISVANAAGCFGPPATVTVNIEPSIIVDAGVDRILCEGIPFRLGGNPTASGGSGNFNYLWSNGSPNEAGPLYMANQNEEISVIVTDSRGCQGRDTMVLDVIPSPRTGIVTAICLGDTFFFHGLAITNAGDHDSRLIGAAANGCDSIVTANVSVFDEIRLVGEVIEADRGLAEGSITIELDGGALPYTVSWSNGGSGLSISNLVKGPYVATIRDGNNCTLILTFDVPLMTSSSEVELNKAIYIAPSPVQFNGVWTLVNHSNRTINAMHIYAMDGRNINAKITPSQFDMQFEAPDETGLYFIKLQVGSEIIYRKLIVQ